MNNGLLYLGCFFAVLLAVLFGVPHVIDWNGYRGAFEEEATKILGRDVRVGGAVSVRFLPTPYVRFEKVRLADPTGQTGEPFLRADSFTMRLAVSPLLRGAFEATEIELAKPVLSLVPDAEGGGNWTTLRLRPAELPFIPQDVTLHSVRLVDGSLAIHYPEGGSVSRIDSVNGELSADSLKGPFKFKGTGVIGGEERDFKLSTTAAGESGAFGFKASMHGKPGENYYLFDGEVADLGSRPRVSGNLTGKLVLPAPRAANGEVSKDAAPVFDLKSAVKADTKGASFEGVELSLDSAAEPQIITGTASARWTQDPRIEMALATKWLDFDLLAAPKGEQTTISGLKTLFVTLMEGLGGGGPGSTAVRLDVDQVKFGGEQAGLLVLDAERQNDKVILRQLKSGLPGSSRFELAGEIKTAGQGKPPLFAGEGLIRGANFEKAQAFAQRSGLDIDLKSQGPFWLAGRVAVNGERVKVTDGKAEFNGQLVSGDVDISQGERKKVTVRLEGDRIDTSMFFPRATAHVDTALKRALGQVNAATGSEANAGASDTSLRIAAREFVHNGRVFKNLEANIAAEGNLLEVNEARFELPTGAAFKASGRIETGEGGKGGLSYEFDGADNEALIEAADLVGLTDVAGKPALSNIPSLKIAGLIKLGQRSPSTADITFDGTAGKARIAGDAGFEAGFGAWKTSPVRFTLTAQGTQVSDVLRLLGTEAEALKGIATRPGVATVAVSGLLSGGAKSYADISADGLSATLTGTIGLAGDNTFVQMATGTLKAQDAREALALAGLSVPGATGQSALEGPIAVMRAGGKLAIESSALKAAGSTLAGKVELASGGGASTHVSGELTADRISVAGLLAQVTEPGTHSDTAADDSTPPIWSDGQFNLESHVEGKLSIKANVLELADDLTARDAQGEVVFAPGKVSLTAIDARAAGGRLSGTAGVEKTPGGGVLSADLKLESDLSDLSPRAQGKAALEFSGSGRGASPLAAVSAFAGKGTIKFEGARHPGPSAALVADASDEVFAGKISNDAASLGGALASGLEQALVTAGSRTVALVITGGDVKAETYSIVGSQGTVRATTTVSLSKLYVDSTWQVAAMASPAPAPEPGIEWKPAPKAPLPAVTFVYTGRLGELAQLGVDVSAEDLSRELAVRIMERKVEELEALRKRDEDRRKQELDKRKALELERQQSATAAAAAAKAQAATQAPQPEGAAETLPPVIPEADKIVPQGGLAGEPVDPTQAAQPEGNTPGAQPVPAAQARPYVPRPQPRPQRSTRSTSEEATKAFGGWP